MRFTSVGPKWRAALRSSLSLRLAPAPFALLPSRIPLLPPRPPASSRSSGFVSLSLAGSRARGAAQTAGMHQMHRADRCPSPFHRFHLFTSAVCLSLFLLPCSQSLFLSFSPSRSLVSFFSGRLLRLRGPLSHPLHRSAAAATPGNGPFLYHRVLVRVSSFSSTPS